MKLIGMIYIMEILETFFYFPKVFKKKYFEDNLKKI